MKIAQKRSFPLENLPIPHIQNDQEYFNCDTSHNKIQNLYSILDLNPLSYMLVISKVYKISIA